MNFKNVVSIILCFSLLGCATDYKGPMPDLLVRGEAAKKEYESFKLRETFWEQSPRAYQMGPDENLYTLRSIQPIIETVSPAAIERLHTASWLHKVAGSLAGVSLIILIVELANPVNFNNNGLQVAFWSSIGGSLGFSIARDYNMTRAAEEYNKDLRSKLTPTVAYNWQW